MNTRKNSFSHSFSTSTSRFRRKEGSLELGVIRFIFMIHNLQKLVHMQRSTSCCIWWCQKDRIITIQQLTLVLGRRAKRGRSLSNSSATYNCEPHDLIRLRASATVGLESREADGCPSFLEKDGQARAELPHREPLTMHANRPLKDIACVLHAQTKDATVVCVIGCQITRTRIHTLPKRLASARHSRVRKLYSYQIHSARFKQTSQWRRKSWWCISRRHLYCGTPVVTSWAVAGQQVVFLHMYLQTESRWGRSP